MTGEPVITWGWAGAALELESGDLHVVVGFPGGALVALLDGLGHGPEAAEAARAAVPVLEAHPDHPVDVLIRDCHEAMRKTRGAVMTVAALRSAESSLTWAGIGNVDGIVVRGGGLRAEAISSRGGVVGYQLPAIRVRTLAINAGDVLVMATDGIRDGFATDLALDDSPQLIAETILAQFAKASDDAHVVVARYLGGR